MRSGNGWSNVARRVGAAMLVLGGLAMAVAPQLPWLTATSPVLGTASSPGSEVGRGIVIAIPAGVATLVAGGALLADVTRRRIALQVAVVAAVAAGIVAWVGYRDAAQPALSLLVSRDGEPVTYAPGAGVWVLFVASAVTLVGALGIGVGARAAARS
jgi:hypothetical protein